MRTALEILTEHLDTKHPHLFYHMEDKSVPSGVIDDGDSVFEAIVEAMRLYAEQALNAAAKSIHPYESGEKRKVMCNTILKLKDQLK